MLLLINIKIVQAGVILEQLDTQLEGQGMMVPLDLGAKAVSHS